MMSDPTLLSHLDAAYNLARWLMGNPVDAEDVVHDAFVRAMAGAGRFRGGDERAWLLAIVRNACYSTHRRQRVRQASALDPLDEDAHEDTAAPSPEQRAIDGDTRRRVRRAVEALAPEFREVIVLREFEGLSYKEIADVVDVPIGTIMSRLSRARGQLAAALGTQEGARA